jgi:hypothetical protein
MEKKDTKKSRYAKLETSQISYLGTRNKTYCQKYSIMDFIGRTKLKDSTKILELFGGIGITSFFIMKSITPSKHTILEIHDDCIERLNERYPNSEILKEDAFTFDRMEEYDYIFIDAALFGQGRLDKFKPILDRIAKCKAEVIITDLGFWKFSFVKKEKWAVEVPIYFAKWKEIFKTFNLNITDAFYTHDFAILCLDRDSTKYTTPVNVVCWEKETSEWRVFLEERKGAFFNGVQEK